MVPYNYPYSFGSLVPNKSTHVGIPIKLIDVRFVKSFGYDIFQCINILPFFYDEGDVYEPSMCSDQKILIVLRFKCWLIKTD